MSETLSVDDSSSSMHQPLRLRDGLTIRELPDGDAVVASAGQETAVIVNATAHAILELLHTARSRSEIASVIASNIPSADPVVVERDVQSLLTELVDAGIVEPCGGESSTP